MNRYLSGRQNDRLLFILALAFLIWLWSVGPDRAGFPTPVGADGLRPYPKPSHGLVEWRWALEGMVPFEVIGLDGKPLYVPAGFAKGAVAISWCESRHDGTRVGLAGERSKWQIHPIHKPLVKQLGFTWEQMQEPRASLIVAVAIWKQRGGSFEAWSCG